MLGLQISVNDTVFMCFGETLQNFDGVSDRIVDGQGSIGDENVLKRTPVNEFEDHVEQSIRFLTKVEEGHDMGTLQKGDRPGFTEKSLAKLGLVLNGFIDDLESDDSAYGLVFCAVDFSETASADAFQYPVFATDGAA